MAWQKHAQLILAVCLVCPLTKALTAPKIVFESYFGEQDRCGWQAGLGWFGLTSEWKCTRIAAGRLDFNPDDKTLLTDAVSAIAASLSNPAEAARISNCTHAATAYYYPIGAAPGEQVECGQTWPNSMPEEERCYREAWWDLYALQKSATWPTIHLVPRFESPDASDELAGGDAVYSGAIAWAWRKRIVAWGRDGIDAFSGGWFLKKWGEPTLSINLALLRTYAQERSYASNVRYYAGTIIHEVLHTMGHAHPNEGLDSNFVYIVDECLNFRGDQEQVREERIAYGDTEATG